MFLNIFWLVSASIVLIFVVVIDIRQCIKGKPFLEPRALFGVLRWFIYVILFIVGILALYQSKVGINFLEGAIFVLNGMVGTIYFAFNEIMMVTPDPKNTNHHCNCTSA